MKTSLKNQLLSEKKTRFQLHSITNNIPPPGSEPKPNLCYITYVFLDVFSGVDWEGVPTLDILLCDVDIFAGEVILELKTSSDSCNDTVPGVG